MSEINIAELRKRLAKIKKHMPLTPLEQAIPSLLDELERLRGERDSMLKSLKTMTGWALYAEECDSWYFSEEQAPGWQADKAQNKLLLAELERLASDKP